MKKIYCNLPIFATAKFSIEKPDNWDDMSKEDQVVYFLESTTLANESSLCHYCSRKGMETDFEVSLDDIEDDEDLDFYDVINESR